MSSPSPEALGRRTAALAVVGDEVLCGRVADVNGQVMARGLHAIGVEVERIAVLPDRIGEIVEFLRCWTVRCDFVFTSGGIGPTHDDVTREAVAEALGVPLAPNPEALDLLRAFYGPELTPVQAAMGETPIGARVLRNPRTGVPGFAFAGLTVLPGVPEILEPMFDALISELDVRPFLHAEIRTRICEEEFAPELARIAAEEPGVQVGSYPVLGDTALRTTLILRSRDAAALERQRRRIEALVGAARNFDAKE